MEGSIWCAEGNQGSHNSAAAYKSTSVQTEGYINKETRTCLNPSNTKSVGIQTEGTTDTPVTKVDVGVQNENLLDTPYAEAAKRSHKLNKTNLRENKDLFTTEGSEESLEVQEQPRKYRRIVNSLSDESDREDNASSGPPNETVSDSRYSVDLRNKLTEKEQTAQDSSLVQRLLTRKDISETGQACHQTFSAENRKNLREKRKVLPPENVSTRRTLASPRPVPSKNNSVRSEKSLFRKEHPTPEKIYSKITIKSPLGNRAETERNVPQEFAIERGIDFHEHLSDESKSDDKFENGVGGPVPVTDCRKGVSSSRGEDEFSTNDEKTCPRNETSIFQRLRENKDLFTTEGSEEFVEMPEQPRKYRRIVNSLSDESDCEDNVFSEPFNQTVSYSQYSVDTRNKLTEKEQTASFQSQDSSFVQSNSEDGQMAEFVCYEKTKSTSPGKVSSRKRIGSPKMGIAKNRKISTPRKAPPARNKDSTPDNIPIQSTRFSTRKDFSKTNQTFPQTFSAENRKNLREKEKVSTRSKLVSPRRVPSKNNSIRSKKSLRKGHPTPEKIYSKNRIKSPLRNNAKTKRNLPQDFFNERGIDSHEHLSDELRSEEEFEKRIGFPVSVTDASMIQGESEENFFSEPHNGLTSNIGEEVFATDSFTSHSDVPSYHPTTTMIPSTKENFYESDFFGDFVPDSEDLRISLPSNLLEKPDNETEANNIFERSQKEPKEKRKITHNHEINMNENVEVDAEEDEMERTPPFPSRFESFKNSQDRPEFTNINDEGPTTNTDDRDSEDSEDYEENEVWKQQEDEVKPRKLPKKKLNVENQPTASDDGSKPPRKRDDLMRLLKVMGKEWKDEYIPTLKAKTEAALLELDKFDEKRKKAFRDIRQERQRVTEYCASLKKNIIDGASNI